MAEVAVPPIVVVTGPDETFSTAVGEVQQAGWKLHEGFEMTGHAWDLRSTRLVCVGTVATEQDVVNATLVAARGAGAVVLLRTAEDLGARFFDDLRRIGRIEHRNGKASAPVLADDQRRLLELLAGGMTVSQAATALGLSPRTAARRLAGARSTLGVRTTRQAVLRTRGTGEAD